MELVIQLLVMVAFGGVCAALAHQRGRNPIGWFFVGFFANCIGLIVLLVIPDERKAQAQLETLRDQNRMLRERIEKDRMVSDQRHLDAEGRLKAHDRALGLDTARADTAEIASSSTTSDGPAQSMGGAPTIAPLPPDFETRPWYYATGNTQNGPVDFTRLRELWRDGDLNQRSLVWSAGMPQWTPISDLSGMLEALHG
jgi:hypothetical protein